MVAKACTHFQKICSSTTYGCSNINRKKSTNFFALHYLSFRKIASKTLSFEKFLPFKWPLVATFSQTRALNSRKYVAKQSFVMLWKILITLVTMQNALKNIDYISHSPLSLAKIVKTIKKIYNIHTLSNYIFWKGVHSRKESSLVLL